METVWLWLLISSFTPDHQITVRELLMPFDSGAQCEAVRTKIITNAHYNIGLPSDSAACVTVKFSEELKGQFETWPDRSSYEEKAAKEKARAQEARDDAKKFVDEYNKTHSH